MDKEKNVFTIPPSVPFLDTLVAALVEGHLVHEFRPHGPFDLADVTLYLPTRRAARAIRETFLRRLGGPLLLPRIRTLGDLDDDEASLLDLESPELPPAVPAMERQLVLTKLVLAWSGHLARQVAELPDEELVVPSSPADAARLASGLGNLMDQVGTDLDAWRGLRENMPAELARYWNITLEFLRIATEFWPGYLAASDKIDPGERRNRLIHREAERLNRDGSPAPVIGAGSTGSVPATATLLAAIAGLKNGAVVLPGLDQGLDQESWDAIGVSAHEPAGAGHPQYGLKLLLERMGVKRDAVRALGATERPRARDHFLSEAMRPASTAERWSERSTSLDLAKGEALRKIGLIEAANEREEALAIAVLLRREAETPGRIAALVTPDRGLARRVAVELKRWQIEVDDSAGRPLGRTPAGTLARLVAETALNGAPAETLLALLKHPLTALGTSAFETRRAGRNLERAVLRGPRLKPGLAALRHGLDLRFAEHWAEPKEARRRTQAARFMSERMWDDAKKLAERIEQALQPLEALASIDEDVPLPKIVEAHIAALTNVAADQNRRTSLFSEEAGEALAALFEELRASADSGPDIEPRDYPGLFTALIERAMVRRRGGLDPRIHIWGALEARLQSVDVVVLGGLNEGTWPAQTRLDPLLSRPMRNALSLEPPERRIGLAAHDFVQALGQPEVWMTRADRQDGEPKVASRWLQRLTAYAGEDLSRLIKKRGAEILRFARSLDHADVMEAPTRPKPSPPVEKRPKQLSVTRIETLIRDPYDIYARSVLKLRPFEPLGKTPDAAERGMLIHGVLEAFVRERPGGPYDSGAEKRLIAIGREAFQNYRDFPEVMAIWWPRFERIARWFVRQEAAWSDVVARNVECAGELQVTPDFLLTSRADRLDALIGGGLAIIDYKTGAPPSPKEVGSLSPQLPLEGLIARQGGFENVAAAEPERIVYYRLTGRGDGGEAADRSELKRDRQPVTLDETLATTERRLHELIAHFAKPETDYPSNKIPKPRRTFVGDYDHLARIAEWVATDQEEEWDERVV